MENQKRIITLAGAVGSGKSSTAKGVALKLGFRHFSSGDLFRQIAKERGLSIEAINLTAEEQKEIDHQVDELLKKMGREEHDFVIDSRLASHWMPQSFKVYLSLDLDTAAERIYHHIVTEGRVSQNAQSVAEVRKNIDVRVASERKRYMNLYGIDITDTTPYDLVVDTKKNNLVQVIDIVLAAYQKWAA